jgi:hypothetical protein
MVRAPKAGYDFPAKSEYREQIWQTFVEHIPDPTQAQVAFFPGPEGLEIPVALKYGFKLENLHAIEAEKIEMPWRTEFPAVNFYPSLASKAFRQMKSRGIVLDAANLDFCSNLSTPLLAEARAIKNTLVLSPSGVVAITLLRGREVAETTAALELLRDFTPDEFVDPRLYGIAKLLFPLPKRVILHAQGMYHSTSPMGWVVVAGEKATKLEKLFGRSESPFARGYVPNSSSTDLRVTIDEHLSQMTRKRIA